MNWIRRLPPSSGIRAIFDRASKMERAGVKVLHLDVGRPEWRLPPDCAESAKQAIDNGLVNYIENRGLPELRNAIAADIKMHTDWLTNPDDEIVVTSGASEALAMAALALLGPDDEVIIPMPAWNHYAAVAELAGARVIPLTLTPESGFIIDPDRLRRLISPHTRMMILNTPGNPTGAVQPESVVQEVARLALQHGFFVFSDEVYRDFVYGNTHVSIARHMAGSDLLLYVNSFSKSFAMTGWRIGYIACSRVVSDALNRIHQYLTVCGVPFAQKAAANVLQHPGRTGYLAEMRSQFELRHAVWMDGLKGHEQIYLTAPGGAFYIFPRISYNNMTGRQFCDLILDKYHVAMVPGDVFGDQYSQHVRISYGLGIDVQKAALSKILEVIHV